mmetsp:Transcript_128964/g.325427  ORF Transcript_128964/g.325427 Transcript_128964/m.325427 type:complete len:393 (+) Transcript_128964:1-1179(+)
MGFGRSTALLQASLSDGSVSLSHPGPLGLWLRQGSAHITSFKEAEGKTMCMEGFRCVSRIGRFGKNHHGEVDPAAGKAVPDPLVPEYEWNCPGEGQVWKSDEFVHGTHGDQCNVEKYPHDCLCISRGSSDAVTNLLEGEERVHGWFDIQPITPGGLIEKHELTVIPHYQMRDLPPGTHVEDVHSSLGHVVTLPREEWIEKYHEMAPKIQKALDTLKKELDTEFKEKVQDKPFVCGEATWPDDHPALTPPESQAAKSRIRRFQLLSSDCAMIRDNAARLIPEFEDEQFFGAAPGVKLNCNKVKGTQRCQQLNCYRSSDDALFRAHLWEFKKQIDQCRPEKDVPTIEAEEELGAAALVNAKKAALPLGMATLSEPKLWGRHRRRCERQRVECFL